jgi:hypothetical protein
MAYRLYPIPVAVGFILCASLTAYYSVRVMRLGIPAGREYFDTFFRRIGSIVHLFRSLASFALILCIVLYYSALLSGAEMSPTRNIRLDDRTVPTDKYELFYPLPYEWYYFEYDCFECTYFDWDCCLELKV